MIKKLANVLVDDIIFNKANVDGSRLGKNWYENFRAMNSNYKTYRQSNIFKKEKKKVIIKIRLKINYKI